MIDPSIDAQFLKILLENSGESVALIDHKGVIVRVNSAFSLLTGLQNREVRGRHILRFLRAADQSAQVGEMVDSLWQQGNWMGSLLVPDKQGEPLPTLVKVTAILPTRGPVRRYVAQLSRQPGVHALAEPGVGSENDTSWDPLTSLPNRALFKDRLRQTLSQAARRQFAVGLIFLDLDNFSLLNDSLGRSWGDQALRVVAQRLSKCLRTSDSVGRIGPDEFALLLADIDDVSLAVRNIGVVARKIYELLDEPVVLAQTEIRLSAAIGITLFPQDAISAESLLKCAETALDHARRRGRNNYQFFSSEMAETARRRFALENSLRYAVEREQLQLFYQPQVDLKSGLVVGAEALARWFHPERGMISPMEFIPVAEETGLIVPLGEWVLRTACRQLAEWGRMGLPLIRVGVNLSALQFQRQDLVQLVESCLAETGIDPRCLDLEITESAIMEDVQKTVAILNKISALGVRLSIDDFGTGYSSLSQLRHFPFQTLKIDRSFLRGIENNAGDAAIVSAIIAMAHSLNQSVIVEGLETEAQLAIMRRLRCNEMQGFLFSAPTSAAQFTEMLQRGKSLDSDTSAP
ncbi:MAG: EAL domain-containing protein [Magnetococcales bacterium]|nr:EAL domain-containing protein [Magnetococcales bacterium]